jgi:uridine kinase
MALASPTRRDVITSLADEILHNYGRGRVIVGIDGLEGSGTTAFAADLVARLQKRGHAAFHARMQDFRTPPDRRVSDGTAPGPDRYGDEFDVSSFRRVLVEPFRLAGSTGFVAAFWDEERDQPIEPKWLTAPEDAILVVDGAYLQRPDIRDIFSYTVWLQGGEASDAIAKRYLTQAKPAERAHAIYDNADPAHPRRIFADSC